MSKAFCDGYDAIDWGRKPAIPLDRRPRQSPHEGELILEEKIYASRGEYYADHKRCPKCGGHTGQTLMGYIFRQGEPFRDENHADCRKCGWSGIVHDLVPER
jgi:hypothetical protein